MIEELKDYYARLLIIQYRNKTKARETVKATTELGLMDMVQLAVRDGFRLENAIGVQLDKIGKYAGVSRTPFGPLAADDDSFRVLMRWAILKNSSKSDLATIQFLLIEFFGKGMVLVFDYGGTMRMSYMINPNLMDRSTAELIVRNNLLMFPMAVTQSVTIFLEDMITMRGKRDYFKEGRNITYFNDYFSYATPTPWLRYEDGII